LSTTPLSTEERAELEQLRAEVGRLRARPPGRRSPFSGKSFAADVLIVLGCLFAPLSLVTVWVHGQVADTDRFVATMGPLIREPAVQAAITDRVTDTAFGYVDVQGLATNAVNALAAQGLPPRVADPLRGLTGPLASSVRTFVHDRVGEVVAGPGVAQLWDRTIRVAHEQMNAVLSGTSDAVVVSGGVVRLDLAPFIAAAKQQLVGAGLGVAARIPEVHPTIAVTDATALERAKTAYSLLDKAATWLPWLTVVVLGLGVYLARDHRRALVGAGVGVALGMLVIAVALVIARSVLIGAVPPRSAVATGVTYDLVVRFLRAGLRTVFAVGIVVALGAFLAGPSTTAVGIRDGVTRGISRARRGGVRTGPVGPWVHTHRSVLRAGLVAVAVLVFVLMDQPSGLDVLGIALGLLVLLAVVQFLDQPAGAG
jgi:hypothetical protein